MEQMTEWEMTLAARKDARQSAGTLRYSPWALAAAMSFAWALLVFGPWAVYHQAGPGWALVTFGLIAPFPLLVSAWVRAAWEVERKRLSLGGDLLGLLDVPALEGRGEAGESTEPPAQLRPGYALDGQIVSPVVDAAPEAIALRGKCLTFVRAGLRRGGWSRSKIAEGPNKLMSGDDWSAASKELQRLNFFAVGNAGLEPRGDVGDILKRLEAAK